MQLPYRLKSIFNTYTGKSKTNFLLVGFFLQSSFESELQISVARQCRRRRGGRGSETGKKCAWCCCVSCSCPQVTARHHVSSGHSSPLFPFPVLSFLPCLFILSSCGLILVLPASSSIALHSRTRKKKTWTRMRRNSSISRIQNHSKIFLFFFYQPFPKCVIHWFTVDLLSLFNSAILNKICAPATCFPPF